MKKTFTILIAAIAAILMMAQPGKVMGQTVVTLWSEDFSSYSAGDVPSGGTYSYVCTNGTYTQSGKTKTAYTKIYDEASTGGGASPELLVARTSGGSFSATIPLSNIEGTLTLTYYQNAKALKVSSTTSGVSGGQTVTPTAAGQQSTTFTGITTSMTSVTIVFETTTGNNVRLDNIVLTGTQAGGGSTPSITADDVAVAYNATNGNIAATINNPVEDGELSASITDGNVGSWLSLGNVNGTNVPLTINSHNDGVISRTATVTLTYTYNTDKTVTKEVTVTQAGYFPTPTSDDYVRISSLDQLVDGCIVIIAARYNSTSNAYYAMANTTSGKPTGTQFNSATNDDNGNEILPESLLIVNEQNVQENYYWVVNITENGYTFTKPNNNKDKIGYTSSTNFATNGNNTEWTIEVSTSAQSDPMVKNYTGFLIKNYNNSGRAFALNDSHNYGPYSTGNMTGNDAYKYNFYLDFFVQMPTSSMDIVGVDNSGGGYFLIASPYASPVKPTDDNGFFANEYDLYRFNQSSLGAEWENWKATTNTNHSDFTALVSTKGYLYANSEDVTLYFTGHPYTGNGEVALSYDEDNASAKCLGWNLIGNPYNSSATVSTSFYIMNDTRDELTASGSSTVGAMEGIFVKATDEGQSVIFTPDSKRSVNSQIVLNVVGNNDNLIDRAIVRFDESGTLPKFMIDESNTKIYIPQNNKNFAVVNSNGKADMPVNFKAKEMGKYTISVNTEGIDMDYLHLIDRLTGEDVNLLLDNSYSFIASAQDVESRFILSFTATGYNQDADEPFAFQNGCDIIVNGTGELQIFDLMGRMVSTQNVNGIETINVKSQGVYIFRLNEKTQKIVVR